MDERRIETAAALATLTEQVRQLTEGFRDLALQLKEQGELISRAKGAYWMACGISGLFLSAIAGVLWLFHELKTLLK